MFIYFRENESESFLLKYPQVRISVLKAFNNNFTTLINNINNDRAFAYINEDVLVEAVVNNANCLKISIGNDYWRCIDRLLLKNLEPFLNY